MTIAKKTAKKAAKKRTGSGPGTPDARGKREAVQKIPAPAATGTGDSKLQNGRSAGIGRAASSPDNSSSRPGVNTQLADRETAVVASTAAQNELARGDEIMPVSSEIWPQIKQLWDENVNVRISILAGGAVIGVAILLWLVS